MATARVEERQLLKAMTWWDGFVIALANPGFLIAALGASIGVLGTTGAFVLWTISVSLGALPEQRLRRDGHDVPEQVGRHRPVRPRGLAQVPHVIGPLATFGYWFAWSSVLAINGLRHRHAGPGRVVLGAPPGPRTAPAST